MICIWYVSVWYVHDMYMICTLYVYDIYMIYIYIHMHDMYIYMIYIYTHAWYVYIYMYTWFPFFCCDSRLHLAYFDDEFSSGHVSLGYIQNIIWSPAIACAQYMQVHVKVHHEKMYLCWPNMKRRCSVLVHIVLHLAWSAHKKVPGCTGLWLTWSPLVMSKNIVNIGKMGGISCGTSSINDGIPSGCDCHRHCELEATTIEIVDLPS